jgi:hypothetical protein
MNKELLYRFTNRLYSELKKPERNITLKKLRGLCGLYEVETEEIVLDYRKEIIATCLHEYLHKFNPDKCETWILSEESKIMNSLSVRQIKNIIKAFAKSL